MIQNPAVICAAGGNKGTAKITVTVYSPSGSGRPIMTLDGFYVFYDDGYEQLDATLKAYDVPVGSIIVVDGAIRARDTSSTYSSPNIAVSENLYGLYIEGGRGSYSYKGHSVGIYIVHGDATIQIS